MPSARTESLRRNLAEGWKPETSVPNGRLSRLGTFPASLRNALLGVSMGVGAPAGALLLRQILHGGPVEAEIRANAFFYGYTLLGTCLVFGVFGWFTGLRADHLRRSRDRYEMLADHDERGASGRMAPPIGIASSPPCSGPEELFEQADRALYEGKREEGARYRVAVPRPGSNRSFAPATESRID